MLSIEEYAVLKLKQTEREFEQIYSFLPPYNDNLKSFSPQFSSLIMDICSNIETIFKETLKSRKYDTIDKIQNIRDKVDPNMGDYRKIFENKYRLSTKIAYSLNQHVEDALGNKGYYDYTPFANWGNNKKPDWWETYTNLKHSQLEHLKEADLQTIIMAYAALFIICSQELNIRIRLAEYGYVYGGKAKIFLVDTLKQDEPFDSFKNPNAIYSKNKHFGYIFQRNEMYDNPEKIFSPYSIDI